MKIVASIWFFEDFRQIRDYLIQCRELFFKDSELNFIRKMMVYIYGVRNIEPGQLRILIEENVSPEKGYLAMTTAERLEKKGRMEGKLEGKLEDAKSFLENGVSLEVVLKSTGLSIEQLKEAGIVTK